MKLGLEYIISVILSTIIPHGEAKVSLDVYKSVRSAKGSCNIPKISQISDRLDDCIGQQPLIPLLQTP
jgi:hypothetical protein